jgi:D-alanyl-D-alanine endopeptidase (penicillin-binding protein 7)
MTPPHVFSNAALRLRHALALLVGVLVLGFATQPSMAAELHGGHAHAVAKPHRHKHPKSAPGTQGRIHRHPKSQAPVVAQTVPVANEAGRPRSAGRPDVRAGSYMVLDEQGAQVLAASHEDKPAPIASITKLMTAMVVLEAAQSLEESITIGPEEVRGTRGSASRLAPGTTLTRGELLRLALMSSENRAAFSLCAHYPGGKQPCVAAMNAKAQALGMRSTRFVEPTGLSPQNVASPRDLSKLVLAASANPHIAEYSTTPRYTVTLRRQQAEFHNTNPLVKSPAWEIALQKTGYIAESGRCLVMRTVIDGRDVIIVLMNSWGTQTRFADARRIRTWIEKRRPGLPA